MTVLVLIAVFGAGVLVGMLYTGCRRGGSVDLAARLALLEPRPVDARPGETPIVVERSPDGRTVTARATTRTIW